VQQWSYHLEGQTPSAPQTAKQPHCHNRLAEGTCCSREAGKKKNTTKKAMTFGEDAIEDDSDMRKELGDDIEGA